MSDEPKPQPVYDYEKGVLVVPDGWFDPPTGTRAVDTGLRTSRGHAIKIRKVPLSEPPSPIDEQQETARTEDHEGPQWR